MRLVLRRLVAVAIVASALALLQLPRPSLAAPPPGRLFEADPPGTFELPVIRDAPDFTVRDAATGDEVRLSDFAGRVVVLSFFYALCPDGNACPLATATLGAAQHALAGRDFADRVVLLSVTFDEERDTPEVLREQRRRAGARDGWIFATPETAGRRAEILAGFDQRIARAPDGTIVHPLRVYLIDGRRRVRQIYSQSYLRSDVLVSDVETVLGPSSLARPPRSASRRSAEATGSSGERR